MINKKDAFISGIKDAIPIALGYFAVSFTLGIAARNAGLNAFQGLLSALLLNASAGQYAVYNLIESQAYIVEIFLVNLIVNARYILMSFALSQRLNPNHSVKHRFFMSLGITDELFSLSIAKGNYINPYYYYGSMSALILWAAGNYLGVIAGNILPDNIVSALSVALYAMFVAAVMPEAKNNRTVAIFVILSYILSFLADLLGWVEILSPGIVTIGLTILIASLAAYLVPIREEGLNDD